MISFLIFILVQIGVAFGEVPKIIALIPPHHNLENVNQLDNLCPKDAPDREKCKEEKLKPQKWVLKTYLAPKGSIQGEIIVTSTPGKGLVGEYKTAGGPAINLEPDSKGTDWSYGSYFEFTVKAVEGDWIQLPKNPFAGPVWINPSEDWSKGADKSHLPSAHEIEVDKVYETRHLGNIVILSFKEKTFTYRKENDNDTILDEEEKKKLPAEELKVFEKPISELFDKDGHLIAWPAYPKGC